MTASPGNAQPEERVAYLEDGTLAVFTHEQGGGWYLWRSVTVTGGPWLAEPAIPGTHHPANDCWRRLPEAS